MGNWYWFLVLRFNGNAGGMLFAFGFSDYVGAQNLEPSYHWPLDCRIICADPIVLTVSSLFHTIATTILKTGYLTHAM